MCISLSRVRKDISDIYSLGAKIDVNVKPVFTSRKLSQILSVKENKPPIVNTQCVVHLFQCDLCDANYAVFSFHQGPVQTSLAELGTPE